MAYICFIVQLIEHVPVTVLMGRRTHGRHLLHSSVDREFNRDCLDGTKETAHICFKVQLIENLPVTVLMGRRRQGRHLLHTSVDREFTNDCLDGTKETRETFAS